jgi:hypothetical protein
LPVCTAELIVPLHGKHSTLLRGLSTGVARARYLEFGE